jgi:hypothetical protein
MRTNRTESSPSRKPTRFCARPLATPPMSRRSRRRRRIVSTTVCGKIASYLERGKAPSLARDALLFAPDTFILLTRLARDPRVTGKNKVLLGSAIAYFVFPLDLMPEAIFGPIGYLDDLDFRRLRAQPDARRHRGGNPPRALERERGRPPDDPPDPRLRRQARRHGRGEGDQEDVQIGARGEGRERCEGQGQSRAVILRERRAGKATAPAPSS